MTRSPVLFVGLTGGIAAGKSTALEALARLGAATFSSDRAVHELYETDEVRELVVARWGDAVAPGGVVDRGQVATHAFADAGERAWLEQQLWPRVGTRMAQWREQVVAQDPPPPAAVVETPLLFEAGLDAGFDATLVVVAPETLRSERASARGHAAVDERTARQLSQEEKASRATFVVENDGTIADLERKLSDVLAKLHR